MTAPKEILDLVERFDRNRDAYKSVQYNETQLRREFLDPFFTSLGWDVENRQGFAEAYKDVIHEDAIKIGGYTKAPDYCFRIGGTRKFFVEAKKPAVDIRQDASPACQLRRYAWSAKLPLSILTDFNGRSIASFSSGSARTAASSRKAGGVFYTPTYIVEYIVRNAVDKLLEGKMPKEAAKLAILDPACGSGSFLIGAFQRLLDWHRDWYVDNGKEKWAKGNAPAMYQGPGGEWRLTTPKRKGILLNNIYGLDIDPQAVEVTKLSLLLKVLEGESEQTIVKQLKMFHERALPDLGNNIKCGNSLIGTDFYNTPLTPLFRGEQMDSPLARGAGGVSDEERYRINPFDWDKEFPEIIKPSPPGR